MSEDNPRLGQVWSCANSIEVIVGWYDAECRVHWTLILNYDQEIHGYQNNLFDHIKEETLSNSEKYGMTNWERIA